MLDRYQNQLNLRHNLELQYKLQNDFILSSTYELDSRNPGLEPERGIFLKKIWKFGLPKRSRLRRLAGNLSQSRIV